MRKLTKTLLPLLLLAFVLVSCGASLVQTSYKSLTISKTTYDTSLSIAGDLYKRGLMTEDQKVEAVKYGNLYMVVHNEATAALLKYKISGLEEDKDAYFKLAIDVAARLATLVDYVELFIPIGG